VEWQAATPESQGIRRQLGADQGCECQADRPGLRRRPKHKIVTNGLPTGNDLKEKQGTASLAKRRSRGLAWW